MAASTRVMPEINMRTATFRDVDRYSRRDFAGQHDDVNAIMMRLTILDSADSANVRRSHDSSLFAGRTSSLACGEDVEFARHDGAIASGVRALLLAAKAVEHDK